MRQISATARVLLATGVAVLGCNGPKSETTSFASNDATSNAAAPSTATGAPAHSSAPKGAASKASASSDDARTSGASADPQKQADIAPSQTPSAAPLTCPAGMKLIPGGPFWAGSETETFDQEENPRFLTKLAPYCLDETEVTTSAYEACVDAGKCAPAERETITCNFRRDGRGEHPINCIDYPRAEAVCASRGARLPSELEWEFAARGGDEQRKFSWGDQEPDGRTCWKANGTCQVKSFQAGAFGLYDVTGNVWEWTSDWFGHYPWPAQDGNRRVYRGGSWSRRFEKWLSPTLRNRSKPKEWGSHLGVRCALSPAGAECPYGRGADGACRRGVEDAKCLDGKKWNGIRCTTEGAPRCRGGSHEVAGYGCVKDVAVEEEAGAMDLSEVVRARTPEFDADCGTNQPHRPHAYRYTGGGHLERNQVEQSQGCKNRDVGVGWNSACCP